MDGSFAPLKEIRALADKYEAWVMVDDCHAAGFIGTQGAGTPARAGVQVEVVSARLAKPWAARQADISPPSKR